MMRYLLSLPERTLRSTSGVAGGLLHELGRSTLPEGIRKSRLYVNLVELTLRFMIEQVGEVEGVFPVEDQLNKNLLVRRTAGGGLETIGILAFGASPVWVLAALADATGAGRRLLADITNTLKNEGLMAPGAQPGSVDQMLDALERSAALAADTINTPPLDVAGLRRDWNALKREVHRLPPRKIPSADTVTGIWDRIQNEARTQNRSVFEVSSAMALSTVGTLPERAYWLSKAARVAGERTGHMLAGPLLEHYSRTLGDMRAAGFSAYVKQQFRPYLRSAAAQFAPERGSWTERLLAKRGKPVRESEKHQDRSEP